MNDYLSKIFQSLKADLEIQDRNSKVLIVDVMNTFMRCFAVNNAVNSSGVHVGGLVGFLNSLGFAIKSIQPTRVILISDGVGSSINKRNIYSDYKSNRNQNLITSYGVFESVDEETSSMSEQMSRLVAYLKRLPLEFIIIERTEADDVISYVTNKLKASDRNITIMSTDQDFLQLVEENVWVYSPTKKVTYKKLLVENEFSTSPVNFLTRKILLGDASDNIPGIKSLGPKKLNKLFPELKEDKAITLENIIDKCSSDLKNKIYANIIVNSDSLFKYRVIMDLHNPLLDDECKHQIDELLDREPNLLHVGEFLNMHREDLLEKYVPYPENWLMECFSRLNKFNKHI